MLSDETTNISTDNLGDVLPAPDLQLENTEPEQNDNISATTLTEDSEEEESIFFEIFEELARSFFAQIDDTRSDHDLEAVIVALWERAVEHKFCDTDLPVLDSLTVEEQCSMIAEFFAELDDEMNAMYNPKSWRRQDALLSLAGVLQEEFLIISNAGSNLNEPMDDLPVPDSKLITPKSNTNLSNSLEFSQQECNTEYDARYLEDDESTNAEDESEEEGGMVFEIFDAMEDNLPEPMLELENPEVEQKDPSLTDSIPEQRFYNVALSEETTEVSTEEEGICLENFSSFKDDEVTATTADESWDESGSITSDVEPMIEPQSICELNDTLLNFGGQETRKEQERRLLRQHRETFRGPKERKKRFSRSKHCTPLDVIHENVGEEKQEQIQCTNQKEVRIVPIADPELKEVIINPRRLKSMQIKGKRKRRKPWYRSHVKRTKKSSNPGVCNSWLLQMVKWWAMTMIIGTYSCAANRYAKMRSNRRFKPGD